MRTIKILLSLSFILIICNACTAPPVDRTDPPTERVGPDGCIRPLETFAYSVSLDGTEDIPGQGDFQIPPPWQEVAPLQPELVNLWITRAINQQIELWFSVPITDSESIAGFDQFTIYRPATREWETVSAEIEASGIYVSQLIPAPDGTLWALYSRFSFMQDRKYGGEPLLSRFNEHTRRFEFDRATQSIPVFTAGYPDDYEYWSQVLIDRQGLVWILAPEDAIYRYDPAGQTVQRVLEIDGIVESPVLAPDGSIYFMKTPYSPDQDRKIFHFDPATGTGEEFHGQLERWPAFSNILVDHAGRLWADALGWREPGDGSWYQLVQSPLFITNILWSGMEYRRKTPWILMESSDRRLWFRSDNGLIWMDPSQEKWCWLSTTRARLVEDDRHNLWTTAYGKLYRTAITPRD